MLLVNVLLKSGTSTDTGQCQAKPLCRIIAKQAMLMSSKAKKRQTELTMLPFDVPEVFISVVVSIEDTIP